MHQHKHKKHRRVLKRFKKDLKMLLKQAPGLLEQCLMELLHNEVISDQERNDLKRILNDVLKSYKKHTGPSKEINDETQPSDGIKTRVVVYQDKAEPSSFISNVESMADLATNNKDMETDDESARSMETDDGLVQVVTTSPVADSVKIEFDEPASPFDIATSKQANSTFVKNENEASDMDNTQAVSSNVVEDLKSGIKRDNEIRDSMDEAANYMKHPMSSVHSQAITMDLTTAKPTTIFGYMQLASHKLHLAESANIKADMDVKIFNTYYSFCYRLGCQFDSTFSQRWLKHVQNKNKHTQALAVGKKILKIYQVFGRDMSLIVAIIPLNELKYSTYKTLQNKLEFIKNNYEKEIQTSGVHISWALPFLSIFKWYASQIYEERNLIAPEDADLCTSVLSEHSAHQQ